MSNYYDMAKYSRLVCARMNSFCRCLAWQFWRREWKNISTICPRTVFDQQKEITNVSKSKENITT